LKDAVTNRRRHERFLVKSLNKVKHGVVLYDNGKELEIRLKDGKTIKLRPTVEDGEFINKAIIEMRTALRGIGTILIGKIGAALVDKTVSILEEEQDLFIEQLNVAQPTSSH